ncbi:MAG: hypothetical protein JO212_19850 [Acetobacteraceae bacterium]|nr:hypothetical protein [Acetobacteraceae bacterium]
MLEQEDIRPPWSPERDAELRHLRDARWSWCRIAAELGVGESETRTHAAGLGLDTGRLCWTGKRPNGRYRQAVIRAQRDSKQQKQNGKSAFD